MMNSAAKTDKAVNTTTPAVSPATPPIDPVINREAPSTVAPPATAPATDATIAFPRISLIPIIFVLCNLHFAQQVEHPI